MRALPVSEITKAVESMCLEMNFVMASDIEMRLRSGIQKETSIVGKAILEDLMVNADLAKNHRVPMCQDTGMAVVFIEVGQDVALIGGSLKEAINEGVRSAYEKGYLRKSVVEDPLRRVNTKDNTPAVIHMEIVDGDKVTLKVAAKGFGSENMSRSKMLKPSDGVEGVKAFVLETVSAAGPNACPPMVVGVGIGGTLEKAALIAKKALLRDVREPHVDDYYADLETEWLGAINDLGIGPQGLGGNITALGLSIEVFPTHIAGLPVVVNINCHASRHLECVL